MKDKAIAYLMRNPLIHMGMIEPIRIGTADILYAETDGVLIREEKSKAYMISVDNFEKGRELVNRMSECDLIVVHQKYMTDYIADKFELTAGIECFQAAYLDKFKLDVKEELEIKQLEQNQVKVVLEHYHKLSHNEVQEIIKNGNLFGGYRDGKLVGFIGNHLEGSIGLLEIFPPYRRLGYGTILESYMVNRMLEKDLVPFVQIETNNEKSLALQNKLGFKISHDRLYWLFN